MNTRLLLRLAVIAVASFGATAGILAFWPASERAPVTTGPVTTGQPLVGGPFTLTDTEGKRRTDAEFRGKHMLVFFGFTNCPDFCPTALMTITQTLEKLGPKADKIVPFFITVDPERDTPAQLRNYAQNFDKRIVMLTGSAEDVAAAARAYRVFYAKRPLEKAGEYTMDHSVYIYLMGPDGKFITHFRHAIQPDQFAETLSKKL
jgi:cytochrome oxidase Cu insertion factor (SCO1/SenC/PrrC family)